MVHLVVVTFVGFVHLVIHCIGIACLSYLLFVRCFVKRPLWQSLSDEDETFPSDSVAITCGMNLLNEFFGPFLSLDSSFGFSGLVLAPHDCGMKAALLEKVSIEYELNLKTKENH